MSGTAPVQHTQAWLEARDREGDVAEIVRAHAAGELADLLATDSPGAPPALPHGEPTPHDPATL